MENKKKLHCKVYIHLIDGQRLVKEFDDMNEARAWEHKHKYKPCVVSTDREIFYK